MKYSVFIKKNALLLLLIVQGTLCLTLRAMETLEEEKLELSNLPNEILFKIAINVVPKKITSANELLAIFGHLTKLMATNKQFYDLIQSPYFLDTLEKKLSKRIDSSSGIKIIESTRSRLGTGSFNEVFALVLDGVKEKLEVLKIITLAIQTNNMKVVNQFLPMVKKRNFTVPREFTPVDKEGQPLEPVIIKLPALIYAVQMANKELVELLLNHGANSNIHYTFPDINGVIAFPLLQVVQDVATQDVGDDIIELLLAHGANSEETNEYGETPLMRAAFWGNNRAVSSLIKHRANIEAKNNSGFTPLLAVSWASGRVTIEGYALHPLETMLVLLKNHANIDAQTNKGKTALMFAAKYNNPKLAAMLLRYGASTELKDNEGRTALSIAQKKGLTDIIALLQKK